MNTMSLKFASAAISWLPAATLQSKSLQRTLTASVHPFTASPLTGVTGGLSHLPSGQR